MHPWHPVGVDRDLVLVSLLVLGFQSADVWEAGILRPNPALAQPAAASFSSGQDFSLGVVEKPLVAGSIFPQDKGWWDELYCGTRGQEVAEGQESCRPCLGSPCAPMGGAVGFVQLGTHTASKPRRAQGMVRVRPQQEGKMNDFCKNPHHHLAGYSFIYMIFLLAGTNNGCAYHTPCVINNFSPGAIFLKRWHVRSLYIGLCSKSQFYHYCSCVYSF